MREQRRNQRFEMRLPLEIVNSTTKPKVLAETRNVSSVGVLFATEEKFRIGQQIEYHIKFPKGPGANSAVKLRCLGTIVRDQPDQGAVAATLERYEFLRDSV